VCDLLVFFLKDDENDELSTEADSLKKSKTLDDLIDSIDTVGQAKAAQKRMTKDLLY
jgi:hypothetical protein